MSVVCTAQLAHSPKYSVPFLLTSDPDVCLDWGCLTDQMIAYLQSQYDSQWIRQRQECVRQYNKQGNPLHGGERRLISKFVNICFLKGERKNRADIKREPSHLSFKYAATKHGERLSYKPL
jgi:hypothetical protein